MVQQVNFNDSHNSVENVQNQAQLQMMQQQASRAAETAQPFDAFLKSTVDQGQELKFSAHAKERLSLRNINLSAR